MSGLVGQLGQPNYAAGNTFLDSFAAYRLQQGHPACSINLGPIEEMGYLANDDQGAMFLKPAGGYPSMRPCYIKSCAPNSAANALSEPIAYRPTRHSDHAR